MVFPMGGWSKQLMTCLFSLTKWGPWFPCWAPRAFGFVLRGRMRTNGKRLKRLRSASLRAAVDGSGEKKGKGLKHLPSQSVFVPQLLEKTILFRPWHQPLIIQKAASTLKYFLFFECRIAASGCWHQQVWMPWPCEGWTNKCGGSGLVAGCPGQTSTALHPNSQHAQQFRFHIHRSSTCQNNFVEAVDLLQRCRYCNNPVPSKRRRAERLERRGSLVAFVARSVLFIASEITWPWFGSITCGKKKDAVRSLAGTAHAVFWGWLAVTRPPAPNPRDSIPITSHQGLIWFPFFKDFPLFHFLLFMNLISL